MSHSIIMSIAYTYRTPHPSSPWTCYDTREKYFADMATALAFLKHEYYYCKKRVPCYVDTLSRGRVQNGWIYCFKSREDDKTHYEQHWISLYTRQDMAIDVTV